MGLASTAACMATPCRAPRLLRLARHSRAARGQRPVKAEVSIAASTREEATTKGAALDAMREALLEKARTLYPDEVDAYVTLRGLDVQGAGEHKRRKKKG